MGKKAFMVNMIFVGCRYVFFVPSFIYLFALLPASNSVHSAQNTINAEVDISIFPNPANGEQMPKAIQHERGELMAKLRNAKLCSNNLSLVFICFYVRMSRGCDSFGIFCGGSYEGNEVYTDGWGKLQMRLNGAIPNLPEGKPFEPSGALTDLIRQMRMTLSGKLHCRIMPTFALFLKQEKI